MLNQRNSKMFHKALIISFLILLALSLAPKHAFSATRWDFNGSTTEDWSMRNAVLVDVDGGHLYLDPDVSDPGIVSPGLSLDASSYGVVTFRMASNCTNLEGRIYFITASSSSYDSNKVVPFSVHSSGPWDTYSINMVEVSSNWSGTIKGIRIDPAINGDPEGEPDIVGFDWIEIKVLNGAVTGGVRDSVTDVPLVGASVRLEQSGVIKYPAVSTNASGNYTIDNVIPGTYDVVGLAIGYQNDLKSATVTAGHTTSQNLVLVPNGAVTGGVRDSVTSVPLVGASVRLEQSGVTKYGPVSTNASGNYTIDNVTPGSYSVVGLAIGYQNGSEPITVTAGQTTSQNLALVSENGTVTGGVRDSITNAPLVGASVRLEQNGVIKYPAVSTNASGNYTINNVIPGTYDVVGLAIGYQNDLKSATVTAGHTTSQNLVLVPNGAVTGGVRDSVTSVPLVGASVRLEQSGVTKYGPVSTNASGNYTIDNVTPGSYSVVGLAIGYQNGSEPITVTAGQTTSQNLALVSEGSVVDTPVFVPFYRLYKGDDVNRDHFYTTNPQERDDAVASGWTYERVEGSISNCVAVDMVPLYRLLYNDGVKEDHFYTTDLVERNNAIDNLGYESEGIAGYVFETPVPGAVALHRLYNANDKNHFYCTRTSESDYVANNQAWTFDYEKVECYVMPSETPIPLVGGRPSGYFGAVNTAVGAYSYARTLLSFPSPGPALHFRISYVSHSTNESMLGMGWSHNYDWRIYETENYYLVHRGNGRMDFYDHSTLDPLYGGVYNVLTRSGDVVTLTTANKTRYVFGFISSNPEDKRKGFYLKQIIDRYNNALNLEYTAGFLSKVTDPVGRYIQFTHDVNGYLETIVDPQLSRTISLSVDQNTNNLLWISDWKGNKTYFEYETEASGGQNHRITKITRPDGTFLVRNIFNPEGQLASQTNALGNVTGYTYSADGTTVTDPMGNTSVYKNSSAYELTELTDPANNPATYAYSADHELMDFTDRRNHTSSFEHNSLGATTISTHNIEDSDTITAVTDYTNANYPVFPTKYTNPENKITSFSYDTSGNLTSVVDPLGSTVKRAYYANGQIHQVTDKNGHTQTYYYDDSWKNLTKTVDSLGSETLYEYDAAGHRIAVINARGFKTEYEFDANSNLTKVTDPLSNINSYTYDVNNRRVSATNANNGVTSFIYGDTDKLLSVTTPGGKVTSYLYDVLGRKTKVTNPKGQQTSFQYNSNSKMTRITTPVSTVDFTYDENGNVLKVIDIHGHEVNNQYDFVDRLANISDPLAKTTHYNYWKDGNIFSRLDANGIRTEYFYDDTGQLKTISYPGSSISMSYDDKNNLIELVDGVGTTEFTYDESGRLTMVDDPYGKIVSYNYDSLGNRTSITYPGDKTVTYLYDESNRLTKVTDWLGGITEYHYDNLSNVTRIDNLNGTQVFFTYDADNRPLSMANKKADGTVISSYSYTLDNVGNITATTTTEPLDIVDQAVAVNYSYNASNQLLSGGGNSYVYDNNGNMIQRSGGNNVIFTYNYENLLTSISGTENISNIYNGFGMRIARTVGGVQTRYVIDVAASLSGVLAETDAAGDISAYYVYGLGLVSRITPTGDRQFYHFNNRGDTIALTDASGAISDAYAYDEFGSVCNRTGTTSNPFSYLSRYGVMDDGDDLFFMRARYYDSRTGRFLSKDPFGYEKQKIQLYSYALNNPVNIIDPLGLDGVKYWKDKAFWYYLITGFADPNTYFGGIYRSVKSIWKKVAIDLGDATDRAGEHIYNFYYKDPYADVEVSELLKAGADIGYAYIGIPLSILKGSLYAPIDALTEDGIITVDEAEYCRKIVADGSADILMLWVNIEKSYKDLDAWQHAWKGSNVYKELNYAKMSVNKFKKADHIYKAFKTPVIMLGKELLNQFHQETIKE